MSAGRKPLSVAQQAAAWKLARTHQLMLLEQGTCAFDDALFEFCADLLADEHFTAAPDLRGVLRDVTGSLALAQANSSDRIDWSKDDSLPRALQALVQAG